MEKKINPIVDELRKIVVPLIRRIPSGQRTLKMYVRAPSYRRLISRADVQVVMYIIVNGNLKGFPSIKLSRVTLISEM
jgi:hypothetical protein